MSLASKPPLSLYPAVHDLPGFEKSSIPGVPLLSNRRLTLVSGLELHDARPSEDAEEDKGLPFKCQKLSNILAVVQVVDHLLHCLHHGAAMTFPTSMYRKTLRDANRKLLHEYPLTSHDEELYGTTGGSSLRNDLIRYT